MIEAAWDAISTAAAFFWKAGWALSFGYVISSAIQVFVAPAEAARHLGGRRPRQLGLAMGLGFLSSSCSFAALSATRSLFTKGASLPASLAFMFASTNLAIEVSVLSFIFLGWQYALALFAGAPVLVAVMALSVALVRPKDLEKQARERAKEAEGHETDPSHGLPEGMADRLRSAPAWSRVAETFVGEWRMVWKELLVGFLVAGAIASAVPRSWFEAIFPSGLPAFLLVPLQALLAPVLAVMTFIGSMGNGPLAAILADNGVVFGAIMTFLYADFVVPPAIKINATYYGRRFAFYLAGVFAVSAVVAGVVIHAVFALVGLLPAGAKSVEQLATFRVDYTLVLNAVAATIALVLWAVARRARAGREAHDDGDLTSNAAR